MHNVNVFPWFGINWLPYLDELTFELLGIVKLIIVVIGTFIGKYSCSNFECKSLFNDVSITLLSLFFSDGLNLACVILVILFFTIFISLFAGGYTPNPNSLWFTSTTPPTFTILLFFKSKSPLELISNFALFLILNTWFPDDPNSILANLFVFSFILLNIFAKSTLFGLLSLLLSVISR